MSNLIYLEKCTPLTRSLIVDAQLLADAMRHEMTTIAHLCVVVRGAIIADDLVYKIADKTKPIIPLKLAVEFLKLSSESSEAIKLAKMKSAEKPNSAYLSKQFCQLISFAQDNEKVTVKILMMELLLMLRNYNGNV